MYLCKLAVRKSVGSKRLLYKRSVPEFVLISGGLKRGKMLVRYGDW